ncbi:hypothetical protein VSDG_03147 [Cytospora chrysosperma]|uniref:Uncharacterized protein n=1 Tax=Cytospora chrysosperma TaxID=252740 RepID=A0A423W8V4_CYTCH|nr:hypothetical protein VSDG_03147 [Valsa sordida]
MSRPGMNTQMLSRWGSGWNTLGVATIRIANPLCYNIRQVSTTPSKKAQVTKKAAKKATPAAPPKEKTPKSSAGTTKPKKASTKAAVVPEVPKAAKPAKKAQASRFTDVATNSSEEAKPAPPTEQQEAGRFKSATLTEAITTTTPEAPAPAVSPATTTQAAATSTARVAPEPVADKTGSSNAVATPETGSAKPKIDPSSPEYKQAARQWVSTMIALPILIVTSYFLFERLASGNKKPSLDAFRPKPRTVSAAEDA